MKSKQRWHGTSNLSSYVGYHDSYSYRKTGRKVWTKDKKDSFDKLWVIALHGESADKDGTGGNIVISWFKGIMVPSYGGGLYAVGGGPGWNMKVVGKTEYEISGQFYYVKDANVMKTAIQQLIDETGELPSVAAAKKRHIQIRKARYRAKQRRK